MPAGHAKGLSEDWRSVWIGLVNFARSLGVIVGAGGPGWGVTARVWTGLSGAVAPVSKAYAGVSGVASLVLTYVFLLIVMTAGAAALRVGLGRFIRGFTIVFWASYVCWIIGSWAYLAATADKVATFGISWSLNLTAEAGFLVALVAGVALGGVFPPLRAGTPDALRPPWCIKTASVVLRGFFGAPAAARLGLAPARMFRGRCA